MDFFTLLKAFINSVADIFPLSGAAQIKLLDMIYFSFDGGAAEHLLAAFCDFGGFASIIYFYRNKIFTLVKALPESLKKLIGREDKSDREERRELLLLAVAGIPILTAPLFKKIFASISAGSTAFIIALIISGLLLYFACRSKEGKSNALNITIPDALITGVFRLLGFIPGISGTGGALFSCFLGGFAADFTAEFTFLTGAFVFAGKGIYNALKINSGVNFIMIFAGIVLAAAVFFTGVKALGIMCGLIRKRKLKIFSAILWIEAVVMIILSLRG